MNALIVLFFSFRYRTIDVVRLLRVEANSI